MQFVIRFAPMRSWSVRSSNRLAVVMAVLASTACRTATPDDNAKARAERGAGEGREVELIRVAERPLEQTVEVSGTLAADEEATVAVKVPGRLASIAVDLASRVERGQAIAKVEATDYQLRVEQATAALAQARAQLGLPSNGADDAVDVETTAVVREARATLKQAEANLYRARELSKEGLTTGVQLEAAEAEATRAETSVQSAIEEVKIRTASVRQRRSELGFAHQQLADTVLRSPLDGIVQQRLASPGEYLVVGAPVARVVRVDPLRLRVAIPERDATSVHTGQAVRVRIDGDPNTYTGLVSRLAPGLDQQTRTLLVEADLKNPGSLRPGSFAHAAIVVGEKPALTVPKTAVVHFAGIAKVVAVEGSKAVEKRVTTGRAIGDALEVLSGLKAGESIVVRPGSLQQGQAVRVKPGA